jgi:hypothetical protein
MKYTSWSERTLASKAAPHPRKAIASSLSEGRKAVMETSFIRGSETHSECGDAVNL